MTIGSKSTARFGGVHLMVAAVAIAGCDQGAPKAAAGQAGADKAEADAALPPPAFEAALSASVRAQLFQKYTGDLDGMIQRGVIGIGVPFKNPVGASG